MLVGEGKRPAAMRSELTRSDDCTTQSLKSIAEALSENSAMSAIPSVVEFVL